MTYNVFGGTLNPAQPNPTGKTCSSQISIRICQMHVQLQYLELITNKTNAAELLSDVFTILYNVTRTKHAQFIVVPQILSKAGERGITKEALNCTASL